MKTKNLPKNLARAIDTENFDMDDLEYMQELADQDFVSRLHNDGKAIHFEIELDLGE